jgi:adenosylcobinamide-GDP ribazoletransferase
MRLTGPLESAALLTVLRVPPQSGTRGVLPWAPLVGLVLGGVATGIGWTAAEVVSPLVGAVLTALALLPLAALAWAGRGGRAPALQNH